VDHTHNISIRTGGWRIVFIIVITQEIAEKSSPWTNGTGDHGIDSFHVSGPALSCRKLIFLFEVDSLELIE
jgi:hypothetical protein